MKKLNLTIKQKKTVFEYLEMLNLTTKHISELLGITEKTGGAWNKETTLKDYRALLSSFRKRIANSLENETLKNSEITNLCKSYESLQKDFDTKLILANEVFDELTTLTKPKN